MTDTLNRGATRALAEFTATIDPNALPQDVRRKLGFLRCVQLARFERSLHVQCFRHQARILNRNSALSSRFSH